MQALRKKYEEELIRQTENEKICYLTPSADLFKEHLTAAANMYVFLVGVRVSDLFFDKLTNSN